MATRKISRSSIFTTKQCFSSLFIRLYTKYASPSSLLSSPSSSYLSRCLRPIFALTLNFRPATSSSFVRCFNSDQTNSYSNPPNKSSPPQEADVFDGCDYEHWIVAVDFTDEEYKYFKRDDVIALYIKTLATIVGSEEEARMKIYNVRTKGFQAFGVLMSEELAYKLTFVENVQWVIPDAYWDVENKDYGGEPFINGQAMPYDPKYDDKFSPEHVTNWMRRAKERNSRNGLSRYYKGRYPHITNAEYQGLGHGPWNMGGSWNMGRLLRNNMGRMLLYTEEYGKNVAVYGRNVKQ